MLRMLKLTVAYDGTRYAGWQMQRRATRQSTIQGTLERVLRKILQEPVTVVGSGRTDAGVHALAQVAHLRTRSTIPCERLRHSLNQLLPPDIAVTRVTEAGAAFHARYSALRKRYRYRLLTAPVVLPFVRPYVHHVHGPLDVPLMRREAAALKGRHDFRAFARASSPRATTVRRITSVRLVRRGDELQLDIEGNGFLHTMVRSIAGTLLDIGRGRLPPGSVRRLLATGNRHLAGTTAPAQGLTLVSVTYGRADG